MSNLDLILLDSCPGVVSTFNSSLNIPESRFFIFNIKKLHSNYLLITIHVLRDLHVISIFPTPAGKIHSGHTAPLHLFTPWNDQVGARHLWGPETSGDSACGRPHSDLGTWSPPSLPRQVKPRVCLAPVPRLPTFWVRVSVWLACPRGSQAVRGMGGSRGGEGSLASGTRSQAPLVWWGHSALWLPTTGDLLCGLGQSTTHTR